MAQCHGHPLEIITFHDKGASHAPTMALVSFEYLKNWNFANFFRAPMSNSQPKKLQKAVENQRG